MGWTSMGHLRNICNIQVCCMHAMSATVL
jgi:hypothetical protein